MSNSRRKSALASTILGMEGDLAFNEDAQPIVALDELDEQMPEELSEDDLSFLDEVPGEAEANEDEDVTLNIEDIVGCADADGKVRMSSIRALAEESTIIPDDMDDEEILSCRTADIHEHGIEDEIGDHANGGDVSMSKLIEDKDETMLDDDEQDAEIKKIVARLDRLANYCERSGYKRLAYKLDVISDKLENK